MDIMREIHDYLVNEIAAERDSFLPDENLLAQGIIDSLGILSLVGFLESRFGLKVSDDEMIPEHFETLAALKAFVERKLGS